MRCKDFIALHSDFRDGIITDPSMERRMRRHQARCRSCWKYAKALELGTSVLRESEIEPSARFRVNLRVGMALAKRRSRYDPPVFGWPARAAVSALVVIAIVAAVAQRKNPNSGETEAAQMVSAAPAERTGDPVFRPVSAPQFQLPAFHQPMKDSRPAAPRVTFSMREDSGFRTVPATFTR